MTKMRLLLCVFAQWIAGLHLTMGFVAPGHLSRPLGAASSTLPRAVDHPISSAVLSSTGPTTTTATATTTSLRAHKETIVRGKLYSAISKFFITPKRALAIGKALAVHVAEDWGDLTLIFLCLRLPFPLARRLYWRKHKDLDPENDYNRFLRSKTRRIAKAVNEIGWLLAFLYFVEIALFILDELRFKFVDKYPVHSWTAGIILSLWTASIVSEFKYYALTRGFRRDLTKSSGTRLLNRIADVLIYAGTGFAILDFLSVQTGFALKSLFGLSSVGTLVFSLASKELVSEFLASLAVQGTNMYSEGDQIMLADGTTGLVQKLGWLNTHIRRSDEVVLRIPNTKISGARLANISRTKLSAIKQGLAIPLADMEKVPKLIDDIKSEITSSCPTLIDGGSRPFRVYWTNYKTDELEIIIDAKFNTKPKCDDYYAVRQELLLATARAAKRNGVNFSYTTSGNVGTPLLD